MSKCGGQVRSMAQLPLVSQGLMLQASWHRKLGLARIHLTPQPQPPASPPDCMHAPPAGSAPNCAPSHARALHCDNQPNAHAPAAAVPAAAADVLTDATPEAVQSCVRWIASDVTARGTTDIGGPLRRALQVIQQAR